MGGGREVPLPVRTDLPSPYAGPWGRTATLVLLGPNSRETFIGKSGTETSGLAFIALQFPFGREPVTETRTDSWGPRPPPATRRTPVSTFSSPRPCPPPERGVLGLGVCRRPSGTDRKPRVSLWDSLLQLVSTSRLPEIVGPLLVGFRVVRIFRSWTGSVPRTSGPPTPHWDGGRRLDPTFVLHRRTYGPPLPLPQGRQVESSGSPLPTRM